MATQFQVDCALMSGLAYQTNRDKINWFPTPSGWQQFSHVPNTTYPTSNGFEASAFQNISTGEIVISYAGTDPLTFGDDWADVTLATGLGSSQLDQAALYYLQIKAANPNAVIPADAMLDRFTSDLQKLARPGGLTQTNAAIRDALIAFAMQKYYEEQPTDPDYKQSLFSNVSGGIRFDRTQVAADLTTAKGYGLYFQTWLNSLTPGEQAVINQRLPSLTDWFVQVGNQSLGATAGAQRAFMLGGIGSDALTGGSQNDLLYGGADDNTHLVDDLDDLGDLGDLVIEAAGEDTDTILFAAYASAGVALPADLGLSDNSLCSNAKHNGHRPDNLCLWPIGTLHRTANKPCIYNFRQIVQMKQAA